MTSAKSAAKPLRFESAQGPSCRRAGRNAPLLAYGGALAISAKVDFKCVPREVTAIVIPTAIPAAIKPYSKDVPPESSLPNRLMGWSMETSRCQRLQPTGEGWSWSPLQWSRSVPNALTTAGIVTWLCFPFANEPRRYRGQVAAKLANYLSPPMATNRWSIRSSGHLQNMREKSIRCVTRQPDDKNPDCASGCIRPRMLSPIMMASTQPATMPSLTPIAPVTLLSSRRRNDASPMITPTRKHHEACRFRGAATNTVSDRPDYGIVKPPCKSFTARQQFGARRRQSATRLRLVADRSAASVRGHAQIWRGDRRD